MWKALSLVIPVLIPSWRFFKSVEPSPRVQWAVLQSAKATPQEWREFRPKPQHVGPFEMLRRLFWNPDRNEVLFVVSCAERIQQGATDHSIQEIQRRICEDISRLPPDQKGRFMQFRLMFVHRVGDDLVDDVVFMSAPVATAQ